MADDPGRAEVRRPKLPKLGESLRFYVEGTLRTRMRSPGIEGYRLRRTGLGARLLAVLLAAGAIALALWWLVAGR